MNRREMLLAAPTVLTAALFNLETLVQNPFREFRVIDDRLSGVLNYPNLKVGEFGWIDSSSFFISKVDKVLYFSLFSSRYGQIPVVYNKACPVIEVDNLIGKSNGYYYIQPSERLVNSCLSWFDHADCWLKRPAMLAYYQAYPLMEKNGRIEGEGVSEVCYTVPITWEECVKRKNPLITRNFIALKAALVETERLKEEYGIFSGVGVRECFDTDYLKVLLKDVRLFF